jgi:DNA-binding MarR family transcriptional regulator
MAAGAAHEHSDRPGEVLAASIAFLMSKLGFLSSVGFATALEPLGITPGHFGLLRIVDASAGMSQQALGEALDVPPSRMVGLVDDLEQRGLVERRRNPSDRRANALHLTAAGKRMLARAKTIAGDWEDRLCAGLNAQERAALLDLLRRVADGHDLPIGVHPGLARPPSP